MKIAFVDDEQEFLDEMHRLCKSFEESTGYPMETVPFSSSETFLEAFGTGGFDLVFMDIYMEGMDGMAAALEMRRQDDRCLLVFLTSSTDFMPDAFSCHAFEYVTKPFSKDRIFHVLSDAVKMLPQKQKYIKLAADRKTVRVFLDEIVSAVTDAHYLNITLTGGENLRCRMTMPEFMERTGSDSRFLPVNKGIAANAEHILEFKNNCCIMKNGTRFPVRVRTGSKIEQMARDYHFEKIRQRQSLASGCSMPADFADRRHGKGG